MISSNFTAKKSLGQNFLHAPQVISAMVKATEISPNSVVLEAGPGKGILTKSLLEAGARVISIEKDDRAIPFLKEKFSESIASGKLKIIHGDILDFDPAKYGLRAGEYSISANIPYYISGEFLRKFLESDIQPGKMVVMLQKELAKRIVDEKGSILSMSVRAYGSPKYLITVPRKFFRPVPSVDSAVLTVSDISKSLFTEEKISEKALFEALKAGFAHKRKVLIKNLEAVIPKEDLKSLWEREKWPLTMRAEELKLEEWKKISLLISN